MEKRNFYTKYDAGKTFCFSVFAPYVIALVLIVVASIVARLSGTNYEGVLKAPWFLVLSTLASPLAFFIVYVIINKKGKINYLQASHIDFKLDILNVFLCILIAFICVFGFNNFVSMFDAIFKLFGIEPNTSWGLPINNGYWLVFNIIAMAVLPAIFEELIFRGIIFNGLKPYGKKKAVIYSALLFSLMHASISQTIYPILAGCVFALIVYKTDNILYSMIIHFCNNLIVVVNRYIMEINNISSEFSFDLSFINIFSSIIYAITAGLLIFAIIKFLIRPSKTPKKELVFGDYQEDIYPKTNVYLWVGVFVGIILWIVSLISF